MVFVAQGVEAITNDSFQIEVKCDIVILAYSLRSSIVFYILLIIKNSLLVEGTK